MAKVKVRARFGGAARTEDQIQQYREVSAGYDRRVRAGERLRTQAFAEFDLRVGDVVLDAGCGTGLSFPLIENTIGPSGTVFGIDQSPEMLALAARRVEDAGWKNVTLIETPIQDATIPALADALILIRVHEITRSTGALANLFRFVRPGAQVLVVGAKWAPWWAIPLNVAIWLSVRQVTTTFEGFRQPWDLVQRYVPDLRVQSAAFGAHYIAHGTTHLA
jgi:demethylmenaquinone methyltransferase/2-methoxy-6-polyprenyl-1,4-benzoquinol methylase